MSQGKGQPGPGPGAVVSRVRPGSVAAEIGLEPGDRLHRVGQSYLSDYIDYRYLIAEPLIELGVTRRDGTEIVFEIEKDVDEDLGLEFTEDIFGAGKLKVCGNRCLFCFVDRLPPRLRPALYVKDDDYRLSFLHGNFVTLTNLSQADLDRILALHLSPLYVSVHATEPAVRERLLGSPRAGAILQQMEALTRGGIAIQAQVVVCPGCNDGEHLERTLADLAALRPGVESVGVVPVGLTAFGPPDSPVRRATPAELRHTLDQVLAWHKGLGGFVYPADEYFLALGLELPAARFYDGYPQLQNGIGLGRVFLDDLRKLEKKGRDRAPGTTEAPAGTFLVVTGELARPLLEAATRTVSVLTGLEGRMTKASNEFLGRSVTVAGLLSGADVERAVAREDATTGGAKGGGVSPVLVPGAALRAGSDEFLDGLTLTEISRRTGRPFLDAGWLPSQMLEALRLWLRGTREPGTKEASS